MNISTSECSSGCESGWTMYLDQSSNSGDRYRRTGGEGGRSRGRNGNVGEEDEDLSMVSDASSGPRHFQEDDQDYCFDHGGYFGGQAKKGKQKKKKNIAQAVTLDTSAAKFKGKSALQKHFGFLPGKAPEKLSKPSCGISTFRKKVAMRMGIVYLLSLLLQLLERERSRNGGHVEEKGH
ncbi:hypothetical protein RJ639_022313 [Escallonia herrerae]|uniref:Uncharacterized protein n=1 Tax=Escallonia herrerae TaxID=1293975 RepID=A0AA88V2L7_9ASTE|nr:hypothetical protein RJ639_022313 [Escallonia herrerae]